MSKFIYISNFFLISYLSTFVFGEEKIDSNRVANTIILDEVSSNNLGIETEMVEEQDFESTIFAIGRIEEIPAGRSVVSTRAAGRIIELKVNQGDVVKKGDIVAILEARVFGNPPPKITLKAPQDGMITDVHHHLGEPVEPDENIFELSDRSKVWATAKIPEVEAGEVQIGSKARIRIPALGDQTITAEMIRFGISADTESGAVIGIFELENPDRKIQPGMRAEFSIISKTRDFVMAVPVESIQGDPAKRVIFLKDFDIPFAYVKSPVVLGEKNDKYVEVVSGVFPGDEVVTKGSYALSFARGGSGMSLKEALDLAHGHEHNEDGSIMTPEQKAERDRQEAIARGENPEGSGSSGSLGKLGLPIMIWAGIATLLAMIMTQQVITLRKKHG